VLILTQRWGKGGVLGFVQEWVRELSRKVEKVYCVVLEKEIQEIPDVPVFSLGKEKGYRILPDLHYLIRLYNILVKIEKEGGVDVIFSHMLPIFTIAIFPYAYLRRIPIVQWYAHPSVDLKLKIAHHLASCVVTSLPTAYRYKKDKVKVLGQGIDTKMFSPGPPHRWFPELLILYVGRISPVKDIETLIKAAVLLRKRSNLNFKVSIVGGPVTQRDRIYLETLKKLVEEENLEQIVTFEGPVEHGEELVEWYRRCYFHVNLTPTGSGDKTVLESMACGKPTLVANEGFRETLGKYAEVLTFKYGCPEDLANKMCFLFRLSRKEIEDMGKYLRERVKRFHSLEILMEKLIDVFEEVVRIKSGKNENYLL